MLYGVKKILVSNELFESMQNYVRHFRPLFKKKEDGVEDVKKALFVSSRSSKKSAMKHSAVSNGLTSIFRLAGVLENKKYVLLIVTTKIHYE